MLNPDQIGANYAAALATATRFFMNDADVQRAARRIAQALEALEIPYAVVGGLAVAAHGHLRVTADVDILLTKDGLERFKERWLGRGWVERFAGSRGLRDAELGVPIDVLLTGDYPGDGKPKPVRFPDPSEVVVTQSGTRILRLSSLIELKLASALSAPHRLQDFADVIALIRANELAREWGVELDGSVRAKYDELWGHAQVSDPER